MRSAIVAVFAALVVVGFAENLRRRYPSRSTWERLAAARGRPAVRAMRERFELAAEGGAGRTMAIALLLLVLAWAGVAGLLDKRPLEVVVDVLPYPIVAVALLRMPATLRQVAERMKRYEDESPEDPPLDDPFGPTALPL